MDSNTSVSADQGVEWFRDGSYVMNMLRRALHHADEHDIPTITIHAGDSMRWKPCTMTEFWNEFQRLVPCAQLEQELCG